MKEKLKNKKIVVCLWILFMIIFTGIVVWCNGRIQKTPLRPTNGAVFAKATVEEILSSDINLSEDGEMEGSQQVNIKIRTGKYKGKTCQATSPYGNNSGAKCQEGTRVIVLVNENGGELVATVYNYDRSSVLWILIVLFLVAICVIGGKKGIASAAGLYYTCVCIIGIYLPMMYQGVSPFLAATITSVLITVVVMFLIGGWSYKTLCAILGTVCGVLIAGGVAVLFGRWSHISGLNVPDVETLIYVSQNSKLDAGGVLFSGILLASLGAVMDVSMSISSTIYEIRETNPEISRKRLFQAGIHVGKDMMGTMSNTLILAFAGSSITTLVMIYSYNMPYYEYMNQYEMGIEILRGVSGSLGVVLTVPFVSFIATLLLSGKQKASR